MYVYYCALSQNHPNQSYDNEASFANLRQSFRTLAFALITMNYTNYSVHDRYMGDYPVLKQPGHMIIIYGLSYGTIFCLALVGNILVVTTVVRNPSMHTVMHYFLVNLASSDLLVAIVCMPLTLLANLYAGQYKFILNWIFFI